MPSLMTALVPVWRAPLENLTAVDGTWHTIRIYITVIVIGGEDNFLDQVYEKQKYSNFIVIMYIMHIYRRIDLSWDE